MVLLSAFAVGVGVGLSLATLACVLLAGRGAERGRHPMARWSVEEGAAGGERWRSAT